MRKRFTFLLATLLSLVLGAASAFGQDAYERVTSSQSDWTGEYLLVYENEEGSAVAWSGLDVAGGCVDVTLNNGVITGSNLVTILVAPMEGGYSIQVNGSENDGKYIYGQSGSNALRFADVPTLNTIDYDGESAMIVSNTSVMRFNSTANQQRFRYYKETSYANQQPVQLYKKGEGGDVTETVATPTFSPEGGTYYEAQQVSIACSTADATVYYTLDGSVPTTNSMVYSSPIAISETTTVKAIGVKDGMNNSGVATATYTIQEAVTVMSIAEARALENNEYALVEGVVTYIDGRNVYIQDATAGIVLYLNSNTVPAELAMGDMVQGYGKKAVYKGLVELSGIDGTNEAEFSILSSGNELPLAVKTIEECLAGGADALQSTRVKIENAVIGAINTSGNTPLTQGESSINIYKIPALTDVEENDNVDVIAVIGYFNNAQLRVASADDVVVVEAPVTTTYSKVVNYVDIVEETQYLLVCESGSTAATAFIQNNALQTVAVTISDDNTVATMVNAEGMPCTISLGSTEGGYYVKVGDLYLNNNSGTGLSLEESAASVWNATVYNGGFILQNTSNNNRFLGGSSAEGLTYKAYANSNLGNEQYPVVYLYKEGEVTPAPMEQVEAPVFSPYAGTFTEAQEVSISCATEGATIYYTLDGTDPTTESTVYSAPITVSETTTIKAMAVKEGMQNSEVVTGTYTIEEAVSVITIAEARALENNEYARVEGVVTFVDGRNIYIQDATAGIVLYLNNNTVPAELAQGDMVQGYGKKAVYKGLVELSGIDGTNEAEFSILSSGNELPLAVKTIEECLAGGADALQSTRVLIQNAVIGAINTSGNTPLTQGESSINIYKVPALTDVEENDVVNVIAVIGYFNNPQLRVASAADVTPVSASLVVTPMMLEGFTYEQGEGPSATQTFTVSGQYLAENLTLSVEQYYEMSLTPEGDFAATLTLPTEDGNLAETTIYVRLAVDLMMNTYESNVVVVNGEDEVTVALSGAVTISNAVATPTFTPAAGHYMTAQMVSIECETEGAVIHYTLDGSDPTEDSPVYAEPIEVSTDMVIKAMATKENWMSSMVASATYEILVPMTIAEARALENNEYATVEGVVTYINNRNVYVQDKTAGIVLYLNNNTVPAELALGDKVLCYGKKTVYSGLVELTGVNGGNENEFAIVSSGNTLPMKRRNIAELLADYEGDNMLQATRVMITNAIIRSINYNGNSLIVQGDNEMNIYKLPEVEGLRVGDFITVKGVVGCHNAVQLLVGSSEDVAYLHRPTINVAMNSLSGFEYNYGHGPSEAQALTVSGEGLTHYIRITPSENYEISAQGGENFMAAQSLLLMQEDGFVNGTVYVRLKEGLAIGSYNESLAITSTQADDVYVSCSGNVYDQDGPVGSDWRKIYDLSELVEGARVIVAARYDNENTDSYYAMTAVTSGKPTGVLFTSEMSGSDEVLPASITNEATTYCWTLGKIGELFTFTNDAGSMLGYSSSTNFATGGDNIGWSITEGTSIDTGVMVSNYSAYNIINGNVTNRAAALNTNHNYGPYSTSNMTNGNGANYNFYLDIFISSTGGTPTVSAPVFDPEAGTYYEVLNVSIACATEDATIYYSTESEEGPWNAYEAPIEVASSMTLWAYAEKEGYDSSAVVSAEYVINTDMVVLFNQDWEGDWNGWTEVSVVGDPQWEINSYSGNHYAYANAYNEGATEDWLISPAFDLNAHPDALLSFRTARNYNGPDIEVYFSNDYAGDPAAATWQPIVCELSTGSWTWVETGDLSMSAFSGSNCYIGYRYTSTEDSAAGWEVDDIMMYCGSAADIPYLNATPNSLTGFSYMVGEGPSEPQTFVLTGGNLPPMPGSDTGGVVLTMEGFDFEMSLDGETYSHDLVIEVVGTLEPTTVYVRMNAEDVGIHESIITIEGSGDVSIIVGLTGEVEEYDAAHIDAYVPKYIQGMNGSNNDRVPVAIATYLYNLEPNSTYRFVNQFVDDNDGDATAGAGNVIYASADGFYRSTSPSLSTEGGYGEFTTDENGEGFVWFINEPTANARFTPGNHVYLRIRINDGQDGTDVDRIFTTTDYATVLSFGNEAGANQGTAFYAASEEAPMSFVMMFSNDYDMRPTYSTSIETTGVDYAGINQYADFYKEEVAGKDGYFGGIIPNDNADGINIIWVLDMESYVVNDYYTENGLWGVTATANPTAGLDEPLFIDLIGLSVDEGEAMDVKVWNFGHEIMVENAETERMEMTVYNLLGQPVMTKTIAGESNVRVSHNLADGLYVITLQNAQGKMSAKIVVR